MSICQLCFYYPFFLFYLLSLLLYTNWILSFAHPIEALLSLTVCLLPNNHFDVFFFSAIVFLTLITFWLRPQSEMRLIINACTVFIVVLYLVYFGFKVPARFDSMPLVGELCKFNVLTDDPRL